MKRFFYFVGLGVLAVAVVCGGLTGVVAEDKNKAVKDPVTKTGSGAKAVKKVATKVIAEDDVPQYLQDISVTIRAPNPSGFGVAEGSGVFKITKDGQVWIWTCGHLIAHLRTERKNSEGKTIIEFADAKIIKVLTEDGRKVGELNFDAEVIRYSHAEYGEDLALLRLRSKKYKPAASTIFYTEKTIPRIGAKLMHCGSLLGQLGSNSVTNGIVSQVGRVLFNDVIFDQTNATSFPGSSGGIVCLEKDGRYVGMLVRGAGETFSLYVPVRRMINWAKKVGVEFAIDDAKAVPTDEELRKRPVDDSLKLVDTEKKAVMKHSQLFQYKLVDTSNKMNPLLVKKLLNR